jgi:hypothetical protein
MKHWLVELVRHAFTIAMNATGTIDATSIDLNVEEKLVVLFDKRR